jgi:hypothetical protein
MRGKIFGIVGGKGRESESLMIRELEGCDSVHHISEGGRGRAGIEFIHDRDLVERVK